MAGERKTKKPKAKGTCPVCGQATSEILECPTCHREGCVEKCIPGGKGTACNACDAKPAADDEEDSRELGEEE